MITFSKCNICGQEMNLPSLVDPTRQQAPLIGQQIEVMAKHITEQHKDVDEALQMMSLAYLGMLRLAYHKISNEELLSYLAAGRWRCVRMNLSEPFPRKFFEDAAERIMSLAKSENNKALIADKLHALYQIGREKGFYQGEPGDDRIVRSPSPNYPVF